MSRLIQGRFDISHLLQGSWRHYQQGQSIVLPSRPLSALPLPIWFIRNISQQKVKRWWWYRIGDINEWLCDCLGVTQVSTGWPGFLVLIRSRVFAGRATRNQRLEARGSGVSVGWDTPEVPAAFLNHIYFRRVDILLVTLFDCFTLVGVWLIYVRGSNQIIKLILEFFWDHRLWLWLDVHWTPIV